MNDIQIQNLKQPLTPIIARAQIALNELAKDKPDITTVLHALRIIEVQGQRQKAMLEQLTMEVRLKRLGSNPKEVQSGAKELVYPHTSCLQRLGRQWFPPGVLCTAHIISQEV